MKNQTTSRMHRLAAPLVLALVVPITASGCGEVSPTPVATADVRWAQSAPSGTIEDDPWVRAVRAGELAYATAVNSSNFTDRSLVGTWREDHVRWFARAAARRLDEGRAFVVLGPRPFTPLAVDVEPSGTKAMVVGCADDLAISPTADDEYPEPWPQAFEFRLEQGPDGQRRITGAAGLREPYTLSTGEALTDEYCGSVPIARGTFDPQPDPRALGDLRGRDLVTPAEPSPTFAVEVPR
ncbi:MAG: hypothetical protein IR158_11735 [Cellulomonas sp.]|uniref:hypothetical protein n=1 Tax=Cellulomonas sp. TaxID=40001 RepID=UPI001A0EAD76|nr:hypothetical protein [Cellulomonas sp.]MBF0688419.1 hypothetical protein [Cellulomonas sp.]